MCKRIVSLLIIVSLVLAIVPVEPVYAAAKGGENVTSGPRRQISKIVFAGLAGAILGLSTLSFYGRPQDRLSYIPVGFAIGVIGGALFTTYKAATEPKDFYGLDPKPLTPELWSLGDVARAELAPKAPSVGLTFSF